jgi:hypothetical protein
MYFDNKFNLGDLITVERYNIISATISGIQAHFNNDNTKLVGFDYDIWFEENGIWYIDHYSEEYLEHI